MSIPTSLVWGRKGRKEQVGILMLAISDAIDDAVELPAVTRSNLLHRISAAVDEWKPFVKTWHPVYEEDE